MVSVWGLCLTMIGFCTLELAYLDLWIAILARLVQGTGFGLLGPAMIVAVKARLTPSKEAYRTGVFSTMIMLPQFIAPSFAEYYLRTWEIKGYFIFTSAPLLCALAIAISLPRTRTDALEPDTTAYLRFLAETRLRPALIAVFVTGAVWGFISTLLSLLLEDRNIEVGYFFVAFGVGMIGSRLILMRTVDALSLNATIGVALGLMSMSLAITSFATSALSFVICAILGGVGYSVVYPKSIVSAASHYGRTEQVKPIALINASFNLGGLLVPFVGGALLSSIPVALLALGISVVAMCAGAHALSARSRG